MPEESKSSWPEMTEQSIAFVAFVVLLLGVYALQTWSDVRKAELESLERQSAPTVRTP